MPLDEPMKSVSSASVGPLTSPQEPAQCNRGAASLPDAEFCA